MIPKIIIKDDVLTEYGGIDLWIHEEAEFKTEYHGGEGFTLARIPDDINQMMVDDMEEALGKDIKPVESFLRLSTETIHSDIRIHSDSAHADFACVVYFNNPPEKGKYGTAFWDHTVHGKEFDNHDVIGGRINVEWNRLLREDSGDITKWSMNRVVEMKKNRMVTYPSKFFHSRYPFKGWGKDKSDGRVTWTLGYNYA